MTYDQIRAHLENLRATYPKINWLAVSFAVSEITAMIEENRRKEMHS